jgi:hypothetical protein
LRQGPKASSNPAVAGAADLLREAAHVAEVYAAFDRDIRTGTRTVPEFNHAVRLTRLIDAVGSAASSGVRQHASDGRNNIAPDALFRC